MAIAPKRKAGYADQNVALQDNLQRAAILKINSNNIVAAPDQNSTFLLNPETYEENKKSNWIPAQPPGNSDPVWQWVSGGARTISFDALVTQETEEYDAANTNLQSTSKNFSEQVVNSFASIAGSLFGTSSSTDTAKSDEISGALDISGKLNYYRSLVYPIYDRANNPKRLLGSPPLVALVTGNSFNRSPYGVSIGNPGKISSSSDVYIVTDLKIRITKQLGNLSPMEAVVSFTLAQYNITSFGSGHWSSS